MKRYLLLLIISTVLASCSESEYGKKKVIDCNCNSPYRDKYLSYSDGQEVKFSNGTDTISFKSKVVFASSYKDTVEVCGKCSYCDKGCYSYCWLSNDCVDLTLSIFTKTSIFDDREIVCAYGNICNDKFNVFKYDIHNLNIADTTLIFSMDLCLNSNDPLTYWTILPPMFKEDTYFKKHKKEIKDNYINLDWINSKSAVQTMTVTEGKGITRIEFECGDIWTLIE